MPNCFMCGEDVINGAFKKNFSFQLFLVTVFCMLTLYSVIFSTHLIVPGLFFKRFLGIFMKITKVSKRKANINHHIQNFFLSHQKTFPLSAYYML